MNTYNFQYCQKIVVLSKDMQQVLLCERKGEQDYDGVYSFIGGKMETQDSSLLDGMQREKNEEIGANCIIKLYPTFSWNTTFTKSNGAAMVLPHYLAIHVRGDITLNEEYSDHVWVSLEALPTFEPKINNVDYIATQLLRLLAIADEQEYTMI